VRAELELLTETPARLVEGDAAVELAPGARVLITSQRLHVHQGFGRPCPRALLGAARRLELDDDTVTWGTCGGHCQIWSESDRILVEDRGSDNGTLVGPTHSARHLTGLGTRGLLVNGDRLHVGRVRFAVIARNT
jgi:hypothetical protein